MTPPRAILPLTLDAGLAEFDRLRRAGCCPTEAAIAAARRVNGRDDTEELDTAGFLDYTISQ